jgi:hypothetical protein
MAKLLIKPVAPHGGDQYGTTMHKSDSHINFPKVEGAEVQAGKAIKAAKPVGGTQYGTTLHDSRPYRDFPGANVALNQKRVEQVGSRVSVDSEKVITSDQRAGMTIKSQNTRASDSTTGYGCQPAVRFPKKGQKSNSTPKVF